MELNAEEAIYLKAGTVIKAGDVKLKIKKVDGEKVEIEYGKRGREQTKTFEFSDLENNTLTIGRAEGSDIRLQEAYISRPHGEISVKDGEAVYTHKSTRNTISVPNGATRYMEGFLTAGRAVDVKDGMVFQYPVGIQLKIKQIDIEGQKGVFEYFKDGTVQRRIEYDFSHGRSLTIGRDEDSKIQIENSKISGKHAEITFEEGKVIYKHLGLNPVPTPEGAAHYEAAAAAQPIIEAAVANPIVDEVAAEPVQAELKRGEKVAVNAEMVFKYAEGIDLKIKPIPTENKVEFEYSKDGRVIIADHHDLSGGPLTIGRSEDSKLQIPNQKISREHAEISLEGGQVIYTHLSKTNPVPMPEGAVRYEAVAGAGVNAPPAEDLRVAEGVHGANAIPAEGGNGGGYTDENGGRRASNEDRGLAANIKMMNNGGTEVFFESIFQSKDILSKEDKGVIPATRDMEAGSTLSIAANTTDNQITVGAIGDSPVFAIMRNQITKEIELVQLTIPDSLAGHVMKSAATKDGAVKLPRIHTLEAYLAAAKNHDSVVAENFKNGLLNPALLNGLGKMRNGRVGHKYEVFTVDPKTLRPPSKYEYMGTMVCSDGIDKGVVRHQIDQPSLVEAKLTELYRANDELPPEGKLSPEAIAKAAVDAVVKTDPPLTHDNVTAMMLPAGGQGMVAVADGNSGSAEVAEMAISEVRKACQAQALSAGNQGPDGGGVPDRPRPGGKK